MLLTILATMVIFWMIQRTIAWFAAKTFENEMLEEVAGFAYEICDRMGWKVTLPERKPIEGLDRYPEDGPGIAMVTRIIVPTEYARLQVMLALRYLHDGDIDTDYMAVNEIVHCYTDGDGEPSGTTPLIVVEPKGS